MNRMIRHGFLTLLAGLLLGSLSSSTDAQAAPKYKEMRCESNIMTKTSVKISWKRQKGANGYKIYRSVLLKNDNWSKRKKIATLPASQISITDKTTYKKTYKYEIVSFSQNGNKTKEEFTDFCLTYMGVGRASWDDYLSSDAITSPDSIRLQYYGSYYGMMPDTYEIYRSKTKKNYKKIASVKSQKNNWAGIYTDKKVTYKTSYYYKVRAFKIINGKKIYGKFSVPILLSAVNSTGIFQAEVLTPKTETVTSLDILLTSSNGNADAIFDRKHIWDASYRAESSGSSSLRCLYSSDGKEWKNFSDNPVVIKPNEKIYLRFESEDGKPFPHPASVKGAYNLWLYDLSYNRLTCYLTVNFGTNTGTVCTNEEYYH